MIYDDDDYEARELRANEVFERQRLHRLLRNPDCRDPDHPGCDACVDPDEVMPDRIKFSQIREARKRMYEGLPARDSVEADLMSTARTVHNFMISTDYSSSEGEQDEEA